MLELSDVTKSFNEGQPNQFTALRGISLRIDEGSMTVLKGPSGSGKTTLLTLIGCMARPTSGLLTLDGRKLSSLPERFLAEIRRTTFGFIFQAFNLVSGVSALENVMLPAYPLGLTPRTARQRALGLLERFRIGSKAQQTVERLSGGEKQRVAIARALMNDPRLIIADEPTAHLDSELAREFVAILSELRQEGKTIIVASHDPIVYEAGGTDKLVALRDGHVVGEG